MSVINPSTGSKPQDLQNLDFDRRLRALEGKPTENAPRQAPESARTVEGGAITLRDVSGALEAQVSKLAFDDGDGFAVSLDGDSGRIDRAAGTNAPAAVAAAGAAGTATKSANEDHVHAGVTSVAVAGNLIARSAAQGAITLTVKVPMLTSDPVSPAAGDMWYRTDLDMLKLYTGAGVKTSPLFV